MKHLINTLMLTMSLILCMPTWATPQVVVSIKPLYDVTIAVMEGVGAPSLLVPANSSPHTYSLAPSQAKALYEADLIVWVGPGLETFLTKPLAQRKVGSTLLTLTEIPGMTLYPTHEQEVEEHGPIDPHLWLDPTNLMDYATKLSESLSELDPEHAKQYAANSKELVKALKTLDQKVAKTLTPVKNAPLMVFHDAYQYFAKRYKLNIVGTILVQPDNLPSVLRVLEIQQTLKSKQVQCIFSEPQFKPAVVDRLTAHTEVRSGVLDPLGAPTPAGLPGIEALFNNLAKNIVDCVEH